MPNHPQLRGFQLEGNGNFCMNGWRMCFRRVMYGPSISKIFHWSRKKRKSLYGIPYDTLSGKQQRENIHENANIRVRKIRLLLFEPCKSWERAWRLARTRVLRAASKLHECEEGKPFGGFPATRVLRAASKIHIRSTINLVSCLHRITTKRQLNNLPNVNSTTHDRTSKKWRCEMPQNCRHISARTNKARCP